MHFNYKLNYIITCLLSQRYQIYNIKLYITDKLMINFNNARNSWSNLHIKSTNILFLKKISDQDNPKLNKISGNIKSYIY